MSLTKVIHLSIRAIKRTVTLIILLLVFSGIEAGAQSAYDQMMQIAGYSTQNVPPPSEPVCAYCRVPSRGAQPWDHQPGCLYYRPRPETQVQTQQQIRANPKDWRLTEEEIRLLQ